MSRKVKITAIQIPDEIRGANAQEKYACNLKNIEDYLTMAGEAGCDLTGIGECSNTRGLTPAEKKEVLGPIEGGREVEIGARLAKRYRMNIVLGIAGYEGDKKRNVGVVIDRKGGIAGIYRKVQLTRREVQAGVVPGDDYAVFDLDFGRIGVVICHDMSFAESTRILGVRRAEIIMWPSNWSGWGRDLSNCMIRCRAIDSGAFLVFLSHASNPVTCHQAWKRGVAGCTCVVSPMGEIVAQSPQRAPGIVSIEVDLDIKRIAPGFTCDGTDVFMDEMLCERRPEIYAPLCDPALVPPPPREHPQRTDA
ncbi:MAG: carbon-nitrogen hydrolase family protein [Kiritimatiellae bacterium]|nr:carbon-nitrogen hydrolase family protein [Kiritimatiellia bacterium]